MTSEWQARLDFLLVLLAIILISLLVFRLLGPQVYAITAYIINQVTNLLGGINNFVSGVSGRGK